MLQMSIYRAMLQAREDVKTVQKEYLVGIGGSLLMS